MGTALDLGQRRRVVCVDLQPGQVERRHVFGDPLEAFGFEVEIDVEMNAHLWPDGFAYSGQLIVDAEQQTIVPVQLGPARGTTETWRKRRCRTAIDRNDVGLQCAKPCPLYLFR